MICGTAAPKKQEGGRFYLSENPTMGANTTTLIPFDTIDFERGNGFDADNHRYVISKKGKYLIILKFGLSAQDVNSLTGAQIWLNGVAHISLHTKRNTHSVVDDQYVSTSTIVSLNKNDYVDGRCYNSSLSTKILSALLSYTHFDIIKLL